MNSRGFKKKPLASVGQSDPHKPKSKSKSKHKQKSKHFNAKQFLEALIDLQNTNCSTNKKKRNTTRDVSSALTVATPILEKTISASKIRSRSSLSQHQKKLKQSITINLCAVITEEDNVQYTEKTARSNYTQNEQPAMQHRELSPKRKNQNLCAIKIQRAWRNFQTYKMVHRIFLQERKHKDASKRNIGGSKLVHINVKKPDFEKTLRIKKEHAIKKQERKQEQFTQTQKIIKERCGMQGQEAIKEPGSPISQLKSFSSSQNSQKDSIVLQRLKERQAEMLKEVIEMIEKQGQVEQKEDLIHKLIQKCENNKKILEKDFNNEVETLKQRQFFKTPSPQSQSKQIQIFQQAPSISINSNSQKSHKSSRSSKSNKSNKSSQISVSFDNENLNQQIEEMKIYEYRLKYIKEQKEKKLTSINDDLLSSRINNNDAIRKRQKIYAKYQMEEKKIEKNKKNFLFSLVQLKKSAIQCQKINLKESLSQKKIRKSFSVGSTVIKQILGDIKMLEMLGQNDEEEQEGINYQFLFKKEQVQPSQSKPLTTTPIIEISSPCKVSESDQSLIEKNNSTEVMKQYSEEIQAMIEKQLINQFVQTVFLDEGIFDYFKPYIQEVFTFNRVSDQEISKFLSVILKYLPAESTMIQRVNQKINPTSEQILRIIRDLDYQADDYELIIPEECFKLYRKSLEQALEKQNSSKNVSFQELTAGIENSEVAEKVYQLEVEKRERMKKYGNYERDLKIMYMKSVFNCINQFMIELKSSNVMNSRSSIGPGQLTLALKQYNDVYNSSEYGQLLKQVETKINVVIQNKCSIPSFKNYYDIEQFQKQVLKQIQIDSCESEPKWVNYMDQVLEIWQDLTCFVVEELLRDACDDIFPLLY